MIEVRQTELFVKWLRGLRDERAQERINARLRRLRDGNPGDTRSVGGGVYEMRIDYGPGYRVYFVRRAFVVVVLLCGGDKSSQQRDIELAKRQADQIGDE